MDQVEPVEVSIVMPCLNEADTLGVCVEKALRALEEAGMAGEVIVADNGSADGSPEIAARLGARVIHVEAKGYGSALMGGIAAARGRFVIMGDADDSYDFLEAPKFVEKLRQGAELVMGCRLPGGGGTVAPGAMPFLHRYWGNPMFTALARLMFGAPNHDIYCGLRGFTKDLYQRLGQRCTGMEFATEMVIKASLMKARFAEVPITLHPDGRKSHAPHLKTFRDGWRTLRFFLLCSPRWLYGAPGLLLAFLGLAGYALALPGVKIGGAVFDVHTLAAASLFLLMGNQALIMGLLVKTYAIESGILPPDDFHARFYRHASLEKALGLSALAFLAGLVLLGLVLRQWWLSDFGRLPYAQTMRLFIPGMTLAALGFQNFLASWSISIMGMGRK